MAAKLTRLPHKVVIQLHLVAGSCTILQFSLQTAIPVTSGYTLVLGVTYLSTCFRNVDIYVKNDSRILEISVTNMKYLG